MVCFYRLSFLSICLCCSLIVFGESPTITAIASQTTIENTPTSAIAFTIGDAETLPGDLTLSGTSSDLTLVPDANIVFGGADADRTVVITPAAGQIGTTTITITVSDGTENTTTNFVLTVNAANTPPTITDIGAQSTNEDTPTSAIAFTIGDAETTPGSLTLSATSSNTTLVPDANIAFGGSGADRDVILTPVIEESGTTTITVTVSDGTLNTSTNFTLTVTAVNDPPTITAITDHTTPEDTPTSAISFTVGDPDTPPASLIVTGLSSNTAVVPTANIVFGGSGTNRTVTITPAPDQSGTSTITVTVSDGAATASTNFTLTVTAVNDSPTVTAIVDQTTLEDTPTPAISFTVGDPDTPPASLIVTGLSSNTAVVPTANIVFGGSGTNRTVTITPVADQSGTSTITVTVSDGAAMASTNFVLTVSASNDPPTVSTISDHSTAENTPTGAIAFTIADSDNPVATLAVTGTSSNTALVSDANIVFGGSGANRTVTLTPTSGQSGTSTITVTVSDGTLTASTNFVLTVNANTPPTISAIGAQSTNQDTPTPAIGFTVGDAETSPAALTLSATSSNTGLVPNANIVFGGSGAGRNAVITPAPGANGTSTITITVSDGTDNTSTNFVLTVNAANTPPTISAIGTQSTNQDTPTGAIGFTVGDAETVPAALTVSATSSNTVVVPNANIAFGGSGASRNAVITPAAGQSGTSNITVTVSDGTLTASTNFVLTVNANTPPTISAIAPQSTNQDTPTGAIGFTVGDAQTSPAALTVSASSSNIAVVPNANIAFGGSGASRNAIITPAPGANGTSTITITVSDGTDNTSTNFVLTVNAANTPPTISAIAPQSTNQDTPTGAIGFTVGDAETVPAALTVSATSSNIVVVPNANIAFGGSGASRNAVITPAAGASGTSTITVTVSDGTLTASTNFVLTVNANTPPTISAIGPQSTNQETPTGAIGFTVGDVQTSPAALTLSATSSNTGLVPNANIVFGGSGASRNAIITPAPGANGTSTITITVSDGTDNTSTNFVLTVNAANTPPTITAITPQSTTENNATSAIAFTIGDAETQPSTLSLSGTSSNTILVPNANIVFGGGNGPNRNVVLTPSFGQFGTTTITITVSDGTLSASVAFVLTVNAVNDPPTISAIGPQTTLENTPTAAIAFMIGDPETSPGALTLSGTSSNLGLVPNANFAFGGSNANRNVVITPLSGQSGTTTTTLTVSDGVLYASTAFILTVTPDAPPTITAIGPQSTNENTPTSSITFTIGDAESLPSALTVSGTSSNTTLVPDANIVFSGTDADRSVVITPAAGQSGTSTITITVSDGAETASINFVLTVNAPPTIAAIGPQSTNESTPTSAIAFTIGDPETPPGSLTLSATSSNATLVPDANIALGGSGASRNVVLTPVAGQSGTSTITITVSDGTLTASTNFVLTVNANTPPTISAIGPQSTNQDTPTGAIGFTVGDAETSPATLTLSATSSNTAVVPNANIVLGGSGAGRNAVITPAPGQSGTSTITVTVSDGTLTASTNFVLTVNANTPPTISAIGPQSTNQDTPTGAIGVTVGDAETSPAALTLSATSSNIAVVPNANIVFGGSGASRNAIITPAPGQSGTSTITVTVSDGTLTASTNFVLTVNAANTPPTITVIGPQSTNQDTPTGAIAFTVGDAETAPATLTLSATSSNTTLIANADIVFGGSGASRNAIITPAPGQSGTSTITVTVSDGTLTASTNFVLTVNANTPPTISAIGPQSTNQDTPTGAIGFTVGDAETSPAALNLSATSSNIAVVPNANIVFGGSGASRNAIITPAPGANGTSTITITVSDGTDNTSTNFVLTVNAANTPPTITAIGPQSTNQDTPTGAISFTVGDAESSPAALTVSATSSNTTVVPNANIVFGGSGASRNAVITPAPGQSGTSTITVTVSDGTLTASTNFVLTVNANMPPTISAIGPQSTNENTATSPIAFTIGDAETAPGVLTLSASSSDPALIPNANIIIGGTGANRDVVITPAAGQSGTSIITITVSDGTLVATSTFTLTVTPANTAPTITAIAPQSTAENTPTAPIVFTIVDAETQPSGLTLSGSSSVTTLVPNANIVFGGGNGANRNVVITPLPGQSGLTTITITVSDGTLTASTNFVLTVNANTPPTITTIGPQSTNENNATSAIAFTISDAETQPSGLSVSGTSSNIILVPNANIVFGGGNGANRNVVLTPSFGQFGTTTITIIVSDGTLSASVAFDLTVNAVNDPPTISAIGSQTTLENTPTAAIAFTIGDPETSPSALTLSGTSSNLGLVPNANFAFGGSDANRNVVITPLSGQSGTTTATLTVSDGVLYASTNFILTVTPDAPPTITAIGPQSTNENTATSAITFTIGDPESLPSALTVSGTSSNTTLVPDANIVFGGTDADRSVVITPAAGQSGTSTITIIVSDGTETVSINFVLTVNAANTPPTITAIPAQSTNENTPTSAIAFTIGDAETPPGSLTVSTTSSNTTLVPDANVVFGGSGANRTVTITPANGQSGTSTVTITVSDGTLTSSTNFVLTVNANTPPTITAIPAQSTQESTPTGAIPFTVGDAETAPTALTVTGVSSNAALVPDANIVFTGSGAARNVTVTPVAGLSGTANIAVTVNDGTLNTSTSFTLTVTAVNDPPTITAITDHTTLEDTATPVISFTVGDPDTPPASLIVTGLSSNTAVVPAANIVFGGSGTNRTVIITPAADQSGTSTITVTVSDGTATASTNFVLTVNANNDPPTVSNINDHSTAENTPTGDISFTVADPDNPVATLTVTGTSSNAALVPDANIVFGGSGANRTVNVTPLSGQSGTSTITITVSDGTATGSTTFQLNVNNVNDPPTISAISDHTTAENTSTGAIAFTIGDAETPAANLTLSASSSNPSLVPVANINFGGSGAARNVTIMPGASQSGSVTITITVSDGTSTTSTTFNLIITPVNDAPTITPIANQTTAENTPTAPILFNVGDAETPAANLFVTGTSSLTTLVPNGNIVVSGTGSDRNVVITPAAGQNGTTTITIEVSDGTVVTSTTFTLTVSAVNDAPTITAITDQTTIEDVATPGLPFTVGDAETPATSLTVTYSSSNKTLVPDANIGVFGSDISRTVTVTPAANQTGTTTITLTVSDGGQTASISFQVTVTAANDTPTITAISDQTTAESTPTAAIGFKVNDVDNPPGSLTVTQTSNNLALVPVANIVLGGSGVDRTVTITPISSTNGVAIITLTVSDGAATAATSFQLTVTSVNDAPTITSIPAQTTAEDVPTGSLSFTVGDAETPAGALQVTASSSNKTVVPDANIIVTINGATRIVRITPASDKYGPSTITLTVSDGTATAQTTFLLTVTPVNDAPTITGQDDLTTPEDIPLTLDVSNFRVLDPDNVPADYSLLILKGNNYDVASNTITPARDFEGDLFVTVKISDGKLLSKEYYAKVVVTDVNIAPVVKEQNPNPINITVNTSIVLDRTTNIVVTDPDSPPNDITLLLSEGKNYTISGQNLNTVTPFANYTGPLEVVIRASDGKAISEPFTVNIEVLFPSTVPLITAQNLLFIDEDTRLQVQFDDLIVADADNSYPAGFTMSILPGENYSVNNREITPAANYNEFLTVGVTVNDGEHTSDVYYMRVYVVPINDAPEITVLETDPISYEPGTGPIPITELFECIDVDNDFLQLARISLIDSNYSETNDELIFENSDTSPIRGVYDASKGVLSLLGYATIDAYIAAIRSIKYNYQLTVDNNGNQTPISTVPKKVAINVNDGLADSEIRGRKERSIELKTSVELSIPNTFTPNGDEANNTWAVQPVTKSDQFDDTIVRVYNKRGLLVYESVGLEKEWDGTFKGELLPVDTYYYTIDLNLSFTKKTYKGAVMILR